MMEQIDEKPIEGDLYRNSGIAFWERGIMAKVIESNIRKVTVQAIEIHMIETGVVPELGKEIRTFATAHFLENFTKLSEGEMLGYNTSIL